MSLPFSRRGLVAGLAIAPVTAPSAPAAAAVSPELAALIAECEAAHAETLALPDDEYPPREMQDRNRGLRARVAGHHVAGLPDVQAKAACFARLWGLSDLRSEIADLIKAREVGLEELALCIVCDLAGIGESEPCA